KLEQPGNCPRTRNAALSQHASGRPWRTSEFRARVHPRRGADVCMLKRGQSDRLVHGGRRARRAPLPHTRNMDRKHSKGGKNFNPETLALGYGYDPFLSEGAVKPPVFLTSTFQFKNAEEGKRHFELAYGLREQRPSEIPGLIYSRLNNPNLEMFERRMAAWDDTEEGAVFSSGMAAISTTLLSVLEPGDVILSSAPVYGGTHYLFEHILPKFGIEIHSVQAGTDTATLMQNK